MKKAINFSDLTQCPFCGCNGFYVRQHAEGTVIYHHSFDGSESDSQCNKFLGNCETNKISLPALKAFLKNEEEEEIGK